MAAEVWARFGNVRHYIEPFAGGLAVLLGRPDEHGLEGWGLETINMPASWSVYAWSANGGAQRRDGGAARARANRHRERIWFSPTCLAVESARQADLFAEPA